MSKAKPQRRRPTARQIPDGQLSTAQLVKETGVSKVTIHKWVRRGWIPKPVLYTDPTGHGRYAGWPKHLVARIRELRMMAKRGVPMETFIKRERDEDARHSSWFYGEVQRIADAWRMPGSGNGLKAAFGIEESGDISLFECFDLAVVRLAGAAGLDEDTRGRARYGTWGHFHAAMLNFLTGVQSVLIVNRVAAYVMAKVAVGGLQWSEDSSEWAEVVLKKESGWRQPGRPHWMEPEKFRFFELPGFAVLDLDPVLRFIWKHWNERPLPQPGFGWAPIVWQSDGEQLTEYDCAVTSWGREPMAFTLRVDVASGRPVPDSTFAISIKLQHEEMQRQHEQMEREHNKWLTRQHLTVVPKDAAEKPEKDG